MSKSLLNQRYCYKVNSSYIKRHKGKIHINDIREGIKNRFIVGIGDSSGTRMIRSISKSIYDEKYINDLNDLIKKEVEKLKSGEHDKKKIKKVLKEANKELLKASLQDKICNVIFDSEKDYDRYSKKGFYLNDKKYVLLLGTTGGVKNNTVMFIEESICGQLEDRINNGADFSIPLLPSKLMAYKSLVFSSSTPVQNTNRILVVKDVMTKFEDKVTYIKFDTEKDKPSVEEIEKFEVELNACDGCGLISPVLAEQWGNDLELEYKCNGFVIRNSWIKGVLTSFDFVEYCKSRKDMEGAVITDVWGEKYTVEDLENVDIIMNESMFKLCHHYESLKDYVDNCIKNGYEFSVTKEVSEELDNERMLNYQYIQCLDLCDEDIEHLLSKDIKEIKEVLGENYIKSILFSKGKSLNEENVWINADDDLYAKALMIDKDCINDSYIKDKIKRAIRKRIDLLKTGKISVNGNYQIAIGEPVIFLESMFGLDPKGLLESNEFYIKYWKDRGIKKVAGFRSPMSCKSNARIMNICHNDDVEKWYGNIKNMIIFNAWDTSMSAFNGEDFDGDINFTTDNEVIIKGIFNLPSIVCEGASAIKIPNPTTQDFIDCIRKSFGNKVGSVTNFGSSCYDKISIFDVDSEEYKEIDYRIKCIQFYQQECIDSAKNGKPPRPIPSYWHDYKDEVFQFDAEDEKNKESNTVGRIEILRNTLTEKKPYYFRYIYKDINKEYVDYIENMETNCLRNFRKTIDGLKSTQNKTDKEVEFLQWYEKNIPLSNNPCVINKIANKVETSFDGDLQGQRGKRKKFDCKVYMSSVEDIASNSETRKIIGLYKDFVSMNKNQRIKVEYTDKEELLQSNKDRYKALKSQASDIIPNEDLLLNTMILLAYKDRKISKNFVWSLLGNLIIENLLKKSNYIINYPIQDKKGDVSYSGLKFKMVEKNLKGGV